MNKLDSIEEYLAWIYELAIAAKDLQTQLDQIWAQEHELDQGQLNRARYKIRTLLNQEAK